ncbi:MAG: DUF4468 domain-containing protein [Prevotella sp.]
MKKFLIVMMCVLPFMAFAQDNTWERIEQEETEETKVNPDLKYLAGAVPVVDGKVVFSTVIEAPGKTKDEIFQIVLKYFKKMTTEANQTEFSRVVIEDAQKGDICGVYQEWLVFKNSALSLDRTRFFYNLLANCSDGKLEVKMMRIHYLYEEERDPQQYTAEAWITDENALRKDKQRLLRINGKFRRKTVDRKDFLFNKLNTLLNDKK